MAVKQISGNEQVPLKPTTQSSAEEKIITWVKSNDGVLFYLDKKLSYDSKWTLEEAGLDRADLD